MVVSPVWFALSLVIVSALGAVAAPLGARLASDRVPAYLGAVAGGMLFTAGALHVIASAGHADGIRHIALGGVGFAAAYGLHRAAHNIAVRRAVDIVLVWMLFLHAFLDGGAVYLTSGNSALFPALAAGVLLHKIPESVVLYGLLGRFDLHPFSRISSVILIAGGAAAAGAWAAKPLMAGPFRNQAAALGDLSIGVLAYTGAVILLRVMASSSARLPLGVTGAAAALATGVSLTLAGIDGMHNPADCRDPRMQARSNACPAFAEPRLEAMRSIIPATLP